MAVKKLVGVAVTAVCLSEYVFAQEQHQTQTRSAQTDEAIVDAQKDPLQTDSFLPSFTSFAEVQLFYGHQDNLFAQHDNERSDNLYGMALSAGLQSDWDKHQLSFAGGVESGRYATYSSENYDDFWLGTDGRYDFNDNTHLLGGLSFTQGHEDRSSPDDIYGDEPTLYTSSQARLGLSHRWDRLSMRVAGTYETLNFDDVDREASTPVNNDDRDRQEYNLGLRLNYRTDSGLIPFAQFVVDTRDYSDATDDAGYDRDSKGYRLNLGAQKRFSETLKAEAYVGQIHQNYDDPSFSDVNKVDLGGSLSWLPSAQTEVRAFLKRSLEETTRSASSGYLLTLAGVSINHQLTDKSSINAFMQVGTEDYQEISTSNDVLNTGFGYRYQITDRLYFDTRYQLTSRDSNDSRLGDDNGDAANSANVQEHQDYYSQDIFFTLGATFSPADTKPSRVGSGIQVNYPEFAEVDWSGLYAGLQFGQGATFANADGARGGSGTDTGDYGDVGQSAGLFLGYGWRVDDWYLAVEGEYENSATSIYHQKSKDESQTINVDVGDSLGAAFRLGYVVPGGSLVYGRLGVVQTEFDTYNKVNNQATGYDDSDTQTGLRYGIGADLPLSQHAFLRLDYSLTDYDDYTVDYLDNAGDPASAVFNNENSIFRVGLGWYFDKQFEKAARAKVDHDGFYAGIQLGQGSLGSNTSGVHQDDTPTVTSNFTGDFAADTGHNIGGYLGYGATFNKFYLGLEAEAGASDAEWNHVRDPNGRVFGVEKKGSYGLGLRLGYVIDSGALLYTRLGVEKARFNTDWVKGGNRDNDVHRDDDVWGSRVGIGAEVPLTDHVFLRFDYSYADYDSYGFTTSHDNTDTMTFDNEESLFQVGTTVVF